MAERPNLLTLSVLAAVAILLMVPGVETGYWDSPFLKLLCTSGREFPGRECKLICVPPVPIHHCSPKCLCDGKVECDIRTKQCVCVIDGWTGNNCSEPCKRGFYGRNCAYKCNCMNHGACDRFSGRCICIPGYQGSLCEEKCPNGTHGFKCSKECKCQNDAACHHMDGSCDCTAGWMGPVCAEPCPEGMYGINCSEACDCFKNSACNVITGDCIYTKEMFECHCDANLTSEAKKLNDSQENRFISNKNNSCFPGFSGANCENKVCPDNKWGETCSNECKCRNGSYCHPVTGVCWCELGWTGEDCSVSLNEAYSGKQIMEEEYPSSHSSSIVPTISVSIVSISILLIIMASIVYYKRRLIRTEDNLGLPSYSQLDNDNKEDL